MSDLDINTYENRVFTDLKSKIGIGSKKIANNGQEMTVLDIDEDGLLTVQFEDGTIKDKVYKSAFKSGSVKSPNCSNAKFKVGDKKFSNCGDEMTIIDIDKDGLFTVQFEDGAIKGSVRYSSFYSGSVKNPNKKKVKVGNKKIAKNGQEMTIIDINKNGSLVVQFEDGETRNDVNYGNFYRGDVRNFKYHSVSASFPELAVFYYIKKIFPDAQNGNRKILRGKEIDIYIPSIRKGVEYDGSAFHNADKDNKKNKKALELGIDLIRIREPKCSDLEQLPNITIIKRLSATDDEDLERVISLTLNCLNAKHDNNFINISRDYANIMELKKDKTGDYLSIANPDIAKEWHPVKNGTLTPDDVLITSCRKVWWLYPYDVPMDYPIEHLRGKHFDFEWQATTNSRMRHKSDCPFLFGQEVWDGFNDLATTHPELAKEWNFDKNKGLKTERGKDISTPDKVSAGSDYKVWWRLPYDVPMDYPIAHLRGKHFDFEWRATPNNRTRGKGCPYLAPNPKVWKGFNDLKTVNPQLAEQWDYEENKGLKDSKGNDISTPDKIAPNSGVIVGWKLSYDVSLDYPIEHLRGKHFDFVWKSETRSRNAGLGCPFLSGRAIWKGFNDLETVNPKLASQWNYQKNKDLKDKKGRDVSTPDKVLLFSHQKVWWICEHGHEWEATISNRSNGSKCPCCLKQNNEL